MTEEKRQKLQDTGLVEWSVFSELVAMDEDEEGFSKSLFQSFVDQVHDTFQAIDENLKSKNLDQLSGLGHYLKGSAAALGLTTISSQCERIQNYGHKINFDNFDINDLHKDQHNDTNITSSSSNTNSKDDSIPSNINSSSHTSKPTTNSSDSAISRTIPDENSDDFWIELIEDALEKARDGFAKSSAALNEYFDNEL
ncbi:putative response regulator phosphotransferase [Scheffersomyces amazonensis]|uniref:putative response regulator phosphotransferase n=1 Tax=Scheffersomyces amazonensis TaxID=1078765 RepID=UPI00315D00BC